MSIGRTPSRDLPGNIEYIAWSIEIHDDIREAILREKRIKRWARAWKVELIEKENEDWVDLWPTLGAWAKSGR
jgi:putative endonuclease